MTSAHRTVSIVAWQRRRVAVVAVDAATAAVEATVVSIAFDVSCSV